MSREPNWNADFAGLPPIELPDGGK